MSNYTQSEIETILKHSGLYSNTLKKSEYPIRNVIRTVAGGSNGVFNLYKINSEPTEKDDKPIEIVPETTNKPTENIPETPETVDKSTENVPETPETVDKPTETVDKPTEIIPEGIISPLGLITPHGVVSELTTGKINPIGLIKPHGLITETPNNQINDFVDSLLSGFKESNDSQKIPETTEETPEITKTPDKFYSWVIEKTPENNSELIEKEPEQTKTPESIKLPEVPKDYGINAREYDIANDLVFKLDSYRKDFVNPIELESLEDTFILYNKGLYASPVVETFDNNFITSGDISKFLGTEITPTEFNENTSELDIISKVKYYLNSFLVMISELFEAVTKGTLTMQKFIDIVLQPSKLIGLAIVLLLISLFVFIRNY